MPLQSLRLPQSPPGSARRVALIVETSYAYDRMLLQGVFAYTRENKPWLFSLVDQGSPHAAPKWLADWDGDGIIARIKNRPIAAMVRASGLPVVDLSIGRFLPAVPTVQPHNGAIGELAADHFIKRGFKHFAYCDNPHFPPSRQRGASFRAALAAAGFPCQVFPAQLPASAALTRRVALIGEWLRALPKPLAVFTPNDFNGQQVLDACRHAGLLVPEEVAVLGVDNDDLFCEMTVPPLSSIIPNARRAGYEAARLLDGMMQGGGAVPLETLIEPQGLNLRRSTDALAVDDHHVARAIRYIHEHVCEAITLDDVVKAVHMSRSSLERRFRRLLNHTVHEEILSARMNHVKHLLSSTQLSMEQIAEVMAYEYPEYLSVVFKREVGISLREYRRRNNFGNASPG